MKSLRNNPNRAIGFMRSVWEAFGKCLGAFLVVVMMERAQLESGRDPAKLDGLKCVGQLHTSNDGPVSGPSFYDVLLSAIWVFM